MERTIHTVEPQRPTKVGRRFFPRVVLTQLGGRPYANRRAARGRVVIACLMICGFWGCVHAGPIHRPTVGIAPFEALDTRRGTATLRDRAEFFTRTMKQVLGSDSTVQLLATDPNARPRNGATQRVETISHMVYGSLIQDDEGALVLSWRLVAVQNGAIVDAGNLFMIPDSEVDSLTAVGQRIAALLRGASSDST